MSICWPGNASGSLEQLDEVIGEREVWAQAAAPVTPDKLWKIDGWM